MGIAVGDGNLCHLILTVEACERRIAVVEVGKRGGQDDLLEIARESMSHDLCHALAHRIGAVVGIGCRTGHSIELREVLVVECPIGIIRIVGIVGIDMELWEMVGFYAQARIDGRDALRDIKVGEILVVGEGRSHDGRHRLGQLDDLGM